MSPGVWLKTDWGGFVPDREAEIRKEEIEVDPEISGFGDAGL